MDQTVRSTESLFKELIGRFDDVKRPGLIDTPQRMVKAWNEMFAGTFFTDGHIKEMLTIFDEIKSDEMVTSRFIPFASTCEHHLLPFTGYATIAYIPEKGKVLGLSKFARLLDVYAKRMQVQERITVQVADALMTHVTSIGAACVLRAEHMCMSCRGVGKAGVETVTSCLRGCFKLDPNTRSEFLRIAMGDR